MSSTTFAKKDFNFENTHEPSRKGYDTFGKNYEIENDSNYISSRMATGKFGDVDEPRKNSIEHKFNTGKSITYEELRKFMWN